MDLATFNLFLGGAVKAGASDLHFKPGSQPSVRISGALRPVNVPVLQPEDTLRIAEHVVRQARMKVSLDEVRDLDTSYALEGVGRFRASVFRQMGRMAVVLRAIPAAVPTLQQLGLPEAVAKIALSERGLILVTGATGQGKTSTLAAMVDHINRTEARHVITIEDPIEYVHQDQRSRITQREVGPDTSSFREALRAALRQDPDVILVGEMRDQETMEIALKAAETGHLVLSTTHTTDAAHTISRIVGSFSADAQDGVRLRLADSLRASISQRLLPRADGQGRVVACEVLVSTLGAQELIRQPGRLGELADLLTKGRDVYGTQSFDQHLADLFQAGAISMDVAKEAATNPSDFERAMMFG
ncbi:MAG: PilT/PilU family type 4a pilus ATPase [Pseudomonadota bacterium]